MVAFVLSVLAAILVHFVAVRPLLKNVRLPSTARHARSLAVAVGVGYGVLGRFMFGLSYANWNVPVPGWLGSSLVTMSVSFLFLVPLVVGFLDQIARDEPEPRANRWFRALLGPMLPVLLMLASMALLSIEGVICIAMAAPALLLLAGIGGLVGMAVRVRTQRKSRAGVTSLMIFLPYLAAPVEHRLPPATEIREVRNRVHILASPEAVWKEIKSVRAIERAELPFRVAHLIGLPRPIEATLSDENVGGVRIARFERGLEFRETVTLWQPGHRLSFAIHAEPAPRGALDEHVAVGGAYFDVMDGTYELEPATGGGIVLTLTSHQRLSTGFNPYARLWSDFIMSDLQSAIMEVVRARSERATAH
jgi:hypothetical protein